MTARQPLEVTVKFVYEATPFDGDPNDAFEIAALEEMSLRNTLPSDLFDVLDSSVDYLHDEIKVSVKPA